MESFGKLCEKQGSRGLLLSRGGGPSFRSCFNCERSDMGILK
jgi:hypothetical protein